MKNLYTLLILILLTNIASAQELKTISRDTSSYQEKFQVLKSNRKIRQGTYALSTSYGGKILTTGFYKNNQRDSIWKEYNFSGIVIAEGSYRAGKKTGEWQFYNDKGKLSNKYDYDKAQLTYHLPIKSDATNRSCIINGTDTLYTVAEQPLIFLGGNSLLYRTFIYNVRYPAKARMNGIGGKVLIAFTVDEKGNTSNYKVLQSVGGGCDEEALRVAKLIPDNWVPARHKGKNATAMMVIPIDFNIAAAPPTSGYAIR